MTLINIDIRHPNVNGELVNVYGEVEFTPSRRHNSGNSVVLPVGFKVTLDGFPLTIDVIANTSEYCWAVVERTRDENTEYDLHRRYVTVPESDNVISYNDLTNVDPTSFEPEPTGNYPLDGMIVTGSVVDGDLILSTYGGGEVNAGFVQGPQGIQGEQGPQGERGLQGEQGIQGFTGDKGDTGERGPQGETGPIGATGPQGIQGIQGIKGDTGPAGATGSRGPQGLQGETGPQGPIGPTGPQGPQGLTGATGARGATGAKGDKGDTGATGSQGISAYQVALTHGFQGTEQEWLDYLNGTLALETHILDETPHPAYDDASSFLLLFENGLV